jgi:hypothetical protein
MPERGLAGKAGRRCLVPALAWDLHRLLCGPSDLRPGATRRGQAGCLAARESRFAETGLADAHRRTKRLTFEFTGLRGFSRRSGGMNC